VPINQDTIQAGRPARAPPENNKPHIYVLLHKNPRHPTLLGHPRDAARAIRFTARAWGQERFPLSSPPLSLSLSLSLSLAF